MKQTFAIALLLQATSAIQRHHHHHRRHAPTRNHYFATGMNGDEDLGQDITMKGEKFHYNQEPELLGLDGFAYKSNQKSDIRGPTTDGPTAGVYQWPTPAPAMAPTPGPFGPTKSLAQKKEINHAESIQSVAGTDVTNQVSDVVHTIAMKSADAHPAVNRDLLKDHNNMWTYPKDLDPELEPKAHIYGKGVTKEVKESEEAQDAKDKDDAKKVKEEGKAAAQKKDGSDGADAAKDLPVDNAAQAEVKVADQPAGVKRVDAKDGKKSEKAAVEQAVEDAKQTQAENAEKAKEESLVQKKAKWDIDNTPRQGDRDYVTAKMWTYPKNQTPDPKAPKNGPSEDDMAEAELARKAGEAKDAAAAAKKEADVKAEKEKKDLKKSVADGKAAAAKEAKAEKKAAEDAVKAADAKKAPASLSQLKDHDEGHVDMGFQPHAILPNTLHAHNEQIIDSVAGPERTDEHMSETVHRSSMEGTDPNPEKRRDIVVKGYNPSFDPQKQASTNPPDSGSGAELESQKKGAEKKAAEAAKEAEKSAKEAKINAAIADAKAATDAAAAKKAANKKAADIPELAPKTASLSQKKSKDFDEGAVDKDFKPHPILPNTLHNDQMEKIDAVAGPDRITQIGESVHRSSVEGGDPVPDKSRSVIGNHPASFTPQYGVNTVKSAGDVAAAENKAKGDAIKAKEAEKAAELAKTEAAQKEQTKKDTAEKIEKLKAKEATIKTVAGKDENAAKIKALEEKQAAVQNEETAKALEGAKDTRKDEDVTLLKTKNKK